MCHGTCACRADTPTLYISESTLKSSLKNIPILLNLLDFRQKVIIYDLGVSDKSVLDKFNLSTFFEVREFDFEEYGDLRKLVLLEESLEAQLNYCWRIR